MNEIWIRLEEAHLFEKPFPGYFGLGFVHEELGDEHGLFKLGDDDVSGGEGDFGGGVHAGP